MLNCKAERDNTNANKHDYSCNRSCSCIYILNRDLSNKFMCNLHLQILASLLVVLISLTSFQDPLLSINLQPSSTPLMSRPLTNFFPTGFFLILIYILWHGSDTRPFTTTWNCTSSSSIQARLNFMPLITLTKGVLVVSILGTQ